MGSLYLIDPKDRHYEVSEWGLPREQIVPINSGLAWKMKNWGWARNLFLTKKLNYGKKVNISVNKFKGFEMGQFHLSNFSSGYYFYWFFYAGVYPQVMADL